MTDEQLAFMIDVHASEFESKIIQDPPRRLCPVKVEWMGHTRIMYKVESGSYGEGE